MLTVTKEQSILHMYDMTSWTGMRKQGLTQVTLENRFLTRNRKAKE